MVDIISIILISFVLILISIVDTEKSRQRRKLHMNKDQVLIKTSISEEDAGKCIVDVFQNTYYKDGSIFRERYFAFNWHNAIIGAFIGTVVYTIMLFGSDIISTPAKLKPFLGAILIFFIISGYIRSIINEKLDYIIFDKYDEDTLIRLNIYDDDGYRLIDEEDLFKIKNNIQLYTST